LRVMTRRFNGIDQRFRPTALPAPEARDNPKAR
jgi:hypothetical protein